MNARPGRGNVVAVIRRGWPIAAGTLAVFACSGSPGGMRAPGGTDPRGLVSAPGAVEAPRPNAGLGELPIEGKACTVDSDCPPSGDPCHLSLCDGLVCVHAVVLGGTPVADNLKGDCTAPYCDGDGKLQKMPDPSDSDDGDDCTIDACTDGSATHVAAAYGAPCAGGACAKNGQCVPGGTVLWAIAAKTGKRTPMHLAVTEAGTIAIGGYDSSVLYGTGFLAHFDANGKVVDTNILGPKTYVGTVTSRGAFAACLSNQVGSPLLPYFLVRAGVANDSGAPSWGAVWGDDLSASTLVLDASGNSYISFHASETSTIAGVPLIGDGIARFDSSGALSWLKKQDGSPVGATKNGYVLTTFDPDLTISSYTADGTLLWAKSFPGAQFPGRFAVDAGDDVVAMMGAKGTIDMGGGPLVPAGPNDAVLAKYDATGKHLWSKRYAELSPQMGLTLAGAGDIVLYGLSVVKLDGGGKLAWKRDMNSYALAAGAPNGEIVLTASDPKFDLGGGPLCPDDPNCSDCCYTVAKLSP